MGNGQIIAFLAKSLEMIGVAIIALAFVHGMMRGITDFCRKREHAYSRFKIYIGRALLLGLEFLVAADVIDTVTTEITQRGMVELGMLIVVRIILGWSIAVEIEGCWPWQVALRREPLMESGVNCKT